MGYCIDTCSLSNSWTKWYPPATFKSFWTNMAYLILAGNAVSVQDVFEELERGDNDLTLWIKGYPGFFIEHDVASQAILLDIMANQSKIINPYTNYSAADPSVIALAESRSLIVVTEERASKKAPDKELRIPDVCKIRGVTCINIVGLMQAEGWSF